jgi:hypothetical protein
MFRKFITLIMGVLILIMTTGKVIADGPYGDKKYRRMGVHNGNQVATIFFNQGDVSGWAGWGYPPPRCEWPKGSGHEYSGENSILVAAELVDAHGNTIHILSESSLDFDSTDKDAEGNQQGWEPLPGYSNPYQDSPAMSHLTESWPESWPDKMDQDDPGWPGNWNGYFGKGVMQADQESYFVMDDHANNEFAFYPDANDSNRCGLGLLVKARGLQWSHVLAEDCIFWLYDITNIGTYNYQKVVFGEVFDGFIGGFGDEHDDCAYFDKTGDMDITYSWDNDGVGIGGWSPVGYFGYAFLESPGDATDGIDNDEDGLLDERRDSGPGDYIFGPVGIFGQDKWHWSGDEDGDWVGFTDINGNDQWDTEDANGNGILEDEEDLNRNGILDYESLNDDVGMDGIGPDSPDYTGPDQGEGDAIPTSGEPHFDKTDVDESDQIGLTSMESHAENTVYLAYDETIWELMRPGYFAPIAQVMNTEFIYGSGYFPLPAGQTERFSLALLMGEDFYDIIRNKQTVQQIYNNNYNFTKPPLTPKLTAVPGNRRVTLYWDRRSESSVDPVYGHDFEGYVIYRSTDPGFIQVKTVTDSRGTKTYRKSIAKFDLINGLKGPHPISMGEEVDLPSGANYYMGDDTGLKHTFVDSGQTWAGNLDNGQTYYYTVVAYDKGYDFDFPERGLIDKPLLQRISPSECASIIETDPTGKVVYNDINTAIVVPNAPAAGYKSAEIVEVDRQSSIGTGSISVKALNPLEVKENRTYQISFEVDSVTGIVYSIEDITESPSTQMLQSNYINGEENVVFDGLMVQVWNDSAVTYDPSQTGWIEGDCNYEIDVTLNSDLGTPIPYPADYEIEFGEVGIDTAVYFSYSDGGEPDIPVPLTIWNRTDAVKANFIVLDKDNNEEWSSGDRIYLVECDDFPDFKPVYWMITISAPGDSLITPIEPETGDAALIHITKPFLSGDKITFKTKASKIDKAVASANMDEIAVVPDPYVATAPWEPKQFYSAGARGERKIDFIHIPQTCTIRIYTIRGELVQSIEHNTSMDDGSESWNLRSKDGMDIAYGIYLYHVDAPGVGQKIGRFAVIK